MLLPQSHYPDFSGITTLEELTLSMARKILETQKSTVNNPSAFDLIDINCNEETSKINIEINGLRGKVDDNGVIKIEEVFREVNFQEGTGSYPFNRNELLDAFFHLALFHMIQEKNTGINQDAEVNQYIDISVGTSSLALSSYPLDINISIADYPAILTPQSTGGSLCKAKIYLN